MKTNSDYIDQARALLNPDASPSMILAKAKQLYGEDQADADIKERFHEWRREQEKDEPKKLPGIYDVEKLYSR